MSSQKIAFVGGSRSLPFSALPLVQKAVRGLLDEGYLIRSACAPGGDALVISAVLALGAAEQLEIYAVGNPWGGGFPGIGCPVPLLLAKRAGAAVHWLAGGPLSIPLRARLAIRTRAALRGVGFGIWFLGHPHPSGSLKAAGALVIGGGVAMAVPVGFGPSSLRGLGVMEGHWAWVEQYEIEGAKWHGAQASLF